MSKVQREKILLMDRLNAVILAAIIVMVQLGKRMNNLTTVT